MTIVYYDNSSNSILFVSLLHIGNIKWRKSVFDATGAPWTQVVDAFLSNTSERSKTVTLVFEREVEGEGQAPSATSEA